MKAGSSLAVALCLAGLCAGARADDAVRLDGLAAVVGGTAPSPGVDAILQSDVELRARITLAGHGADPRRSEPMTDALLRATLLEIIGEHLIAREARRVQAGTPSAADLNQERTRLVRAVGGAERMRALLTALSADDEELDAIARRRALVGAFLAANLEGITVVTDSEVQAALAADPDAGADTPAVRGEIRARLAREALDHTIARWVTVLRARTPLRVFVAY